MFKGLRLFRSLEYVFGAMQNRQIPDETITSRLICVILVGSEINGAFT